MIRVESRLGSIKTISADVAVWFAFEDGRTLGGQLTTLQRLIGEELLPPNGIPFAARERQILPLFPRRLRTPRLLVVGLGKSADISPERIRRGTAIAARTAREMSAKSFAVFEPDPALVTQLAPTPRENAAEIFATAAAEGIILGLYRYERYLTKQEYRKNDPEVAYLVTESPTRRRGVAAGAAYGSAAAEACCFARDLANAPGNELYPETLAKAARIAGKRTGLRVTVFDKRRIKSEQMGGLLGVSRGSHHPPRFIIMEYRGGPRKQKPVVLIGKGVTFDSGGISIKPSSGMSEMKMDMSGAAAVIATIQAASNLKLPLNVIGLVPATENLPGGSAFKPGDILIHQNGMTSEIDNTDAEGRLILADALGFAARFAPSVVIDLATLTGAVVVALGHYVTGMMGNDQACMQALKESGERTYERVWELPLFEEFDQLIKSEVADVKNTGGRWAGAISAALFLKKFVSGYPWVHLDIAGTAILPESSDYAPRGGSGVGVRLLLDFLRRRATD
jgi:leucyl aminopeptidase